MELLQRADRIRPEIDRVDRTRFAELLGTVREAFRARASELESSRLKKPGEAPGAQVDHVWRKVHAGDMAANDHGLHATNEVATTKTNLDYTIVGFEAQRRQGQLIHRRVSPVE